MSDNLTQSDPDEYKDLVLQAEDAHDYRIVAATSAARTATQYPIIWTPRFIIIFFLLLATGLSGASILTQGWLNGYYRAGWVMLAYIAVNLGSWISVSICARSPWVRLGGIFVCLWAILMGLAFALSAFAIDPDIIILTHATGAASSALLGSYLCLSIARTPLQRWDSTFFFLTPIAGGILVAAIVFLAPGQMPSLAQLESCIARAELWLCTAVWWLRPSCWRTQPGPAFLLGVVPLIQLTLISPANGNSESVFFFSQVMLLSLLLGAVRIWQCEQMIGCKNPTRIQCELRH